MTNRNKQIDYLRALGLLLIILAHVYPPTFIAQIRCFDVILMVFISGLSFSSKKIDSYTDYIFSRAKRLILPVWIFLFIYLTAFYLIQPYIWDEEYLTKRMIIRSFLLLDESIGYVWIIRVFLVISIIAPILLRINNMISSTRFFLVFFISLVFLEILVYKISNFLPDGFFKEFWVSIIVYGIGYTIPFLLGIRLKVSNDYKILIIITILFAICFSMFIINNDGTYKLTPQFKEPPHMYYITYGILISSLLWFFRYKWERICDYRTSKMILFIGQNTIWIYLWHMPFALLSNLLPCNWGIKYLFVFIPALLIFCIQYKLVININNEKIKKIFIG